MLSSGDTTGGRCHDVVQLQASTGFHVNWSAACASSRAVALNPDEVTQADRAADSYQTMLPSGNHAGAKTGVTASQIRQYSQSRRAPALVGGRLLDLRLHEEATLGDIHATRSDKEARARQYSRNRRAPAVVGGRLLEADRHEVHEPVRDSAVALVGVGVAERVAEPVERALGGAKVQVVALRQHHALRSQPERVSLL